MFATQIAPHLVSQALQAYRSNFCPSKQLERPYAAISVIVVAADDDDTARFLFTSTQQIMLARLRRIQGQMPPPVPHIEDISTPEERVGLAKFLPLAVVGCPARICAELDRIIAETGADELLVLSLIHDQAARRHSFEILARPEAFALDRPD